MTISALRVRVEELEEENRILHGVLEGLRIQRWRGIPISRSRTLILGMLATGRCFSTEQFLDALQARYPLDDDRGQETVHTHIFRLRQILSAFEPPIFIRNIWGEGYIMDPEDLARLHARKESNVP